MSDVKLSIEVQADAAQAQAALEEMNRRVEETAKATQGLGEGQFSVDTSRAQAALSELEAAIQEIGNVEVGATADTSRAQAALSELAAFINAVPDAEAGASVDTGRAQAALSELAAAIDAMPDGQFSVDTSRAQDELAELNTDIRDMPDAETNAEADTGRAQVSLSDLERLVMEIAAALKHLGGMDANLDASGGIAAMEGLCTSADAAGDSVEGVNGTGIELDSGDAVESIERVENEAEAAGEAMQASGNLGEQALGHVTTAAVSLERGIRRTAETIKHAMGSAASSMQQSLTHAMGNLISGGIQKLTGAISSAFSTAAKSVVEFGAAQEQARLKYQVLLGDVAKGDKLFARLQEFANITPFSSDDVIKAGQALLSFGTAAGDVENTLRAVGNAAAATGTSAAEMANIFGKAMVKGKVEAETLNQMSERGVPIVRALAQTMGVSEQAIYKMTSQGKIKADDLRKAFFSLSESGGSFSGMMEQQAETVGGKWSTLQGKIQLIAGTLGEQLAPIMGKIMDYAIRLADALNLEVATGRAVKAIGGFVQAAIPVLAEVATYVYSMFEGIRMAFNLVVNTVKGLWNMLIGSLKVGVGGFLSSLEMFLESVLKAYNTVASTVGMDVVDEKVSLGGRELVESGASQAKEGWSQVTTGNMDVMNASLDRYEGFRDAADGVAEKISGMIGNVTEGITENIRKTAENAEKAVLGGGNAPASEDDGMGGASSAAKGMEVDSLAKIGLYNFAQAATDSLDMRRNRLLEGIKSGIDALRGGKAPAQMEVRAV